MSFKFNFNSTTLRPYDIIAPSAPRWMNHTVAVDKARNKERKPVHVHHPSELE